MTRLNELLGTEFPIVQGGMANIATAEFAAAVSNAGAPGTHRRRRPWMQRAFGRAYAGAGP